VKSRSLQAIPVVALLIALNLRSQNADVPPGVKIFAAQYVAAFNAKDTPAVESLYLPRSRACITPTTRRIYEDLLSLQMRDSVPGKYVLSFLPVNEGMLKALSAEGYFVLHPERELHIDYQYSGTNDGGQIVLWLVSQNGRWMADFPCMTTKGIQNFRDSAAAREHYKALAASIKEPLRSELMAMLRAHKTGEAETRYQQVNGGDMGTAMLVINALHDQTP
jgi:hypothetical protein